MNLLFDIWIKYPDYKDYKPEEELAIKTIWEYVYDRIFLLIDEMEAEENNGNGISKAVVIYLMNVPKAIQPRGYSDKLCDKINACFNENDGKLMWESVEQSLKGLMN
jgi:hypothetical protein